MKLLGAWRLVEWVVRVDGERRPSRFGPRPRGRLVYAPGHMAAALMGDEGQYLSYCGPWRFEEGRVTHTVELCNWSDWIGRELVRRVSFEGEQLALDTEPETSRSGRVILNRLVWRRALPGESTSS